MSNAKPILGYPTRSAAAVALRAAGLSTAEIAAHLGVKHATVTALEHSAGRRRSTRPSEAMGRMPSEKGIREYFGLSHGRTDGWSTEQIKFLLGVIDSEREARQKLETAYRKQDAAMGVLWERLTAAGVDCSDLIL